MVKQDSNRGGLIPPTQGSRPYYIENQYSKREGGHWTLSFAHLGSIAKFYKQLDRCRLQNLTPVIFYLSNATPFKL